MQEYSKYAQRLENLTKRFLMQELSQDEFQNFLGSVFDGEPSVELRRAVSLEQQRSSGAFFTPQELAEIAIGPLRASVNEKSIIADIACGAGDLLLACTKNAGSNLSVSELLSVWNRQLTGCDIYSEFISVAKWRLTLSALQQSKRIDIAEVGLTEFFPNLTAQNGLHSKELLKKATHVVLNPPFVMVPTPAGSDWANGKVNLAAVFLDYCISHAQPGTRIISILPDVLRSGTLYRKWRRHIETRTEEIRTELYGQFDRWADVHVFILDLVVTERPEQIHSWRLTTVESSVTLSDYFDIKVGSVVDYRDPHSGNLHPFVKPTDLPPWLILTKIDGRRRFSGNTFAPPFVAVRRTSRQEDKFRAVATIVDGSEPVAVENHLIVLTPRSGNLDDCEKLLENFKSPETNQWLNQRIRCRHLTVSALKSLPWWLDEIVK